MPTPFPTLPTGIYYLPTRTSIKFAIRFMIEGARITLPPTDSLAEAINAMMDFRIADLETRRKHMLASAGAKMDQTRNALNIVASELTQAEQQALADYTELMESVAPSDMSFGEDAMIGGVTIPAKIVTAFLNRLYGVS